jgi:nucleoside recognition membrane protein YjiH
VCGAADAGGLAVWFCRWKGKDSVSVRTVLNFIFLGGCLWRIVPKFVGPRVSLELAGERFLVQLVLWIFFGGFSGGWPCPRSSAG